MEIYNLKEKSLLVTRYILKNQLEPTDENILKSWSAISLSDKSIVDAELIEWIRKASINNDIKSCDKKLANIRRTGEKNLKDKGKGVDYGAKLVVSPKQALATYNIFTHGRKFSGNYHSLSRKLGQFN